MLLFSRVMNLTGSPRQGAPWAMGITEHVNAHSGLDVSLWQYSFGQPLGTIAFSSIVESQSAFVAAASGLLADDAYMDLVEQAPINPAIASVDHLREFVYIPEPAGEPLGVGAVATLTSGIANLDRMADAVGWGVEIAQHVTSVTGTGVAVLTNVFGQMGEITWIGLAADLGAAEAARAKLSADADYMGRIAATKDLFIQGSGSTSQLTRLA